MPWIIQSISEGPICITDIGSMTLTKGQIRDLDIIGRENAERSNDIKLLLLKGFIKTLRKDPVQAHGSSSFDPQIIDQLKAATDAVSQSNKQNNELQQHNIKLQEELELQKKKADEAISISQKILEEVRAFSENDPLGIRTIKEALENIKAERIVVAQQISNIESKENVSEGELKAHEQILKTKEKKLEKNFESLGKTISKSSDVDDILDILDKEGIF